MKKIPPLITVIILFTVTICSFFTGCSSTDFDGSQIILKVMSWEEYIDDDDYEDDINGIYQGSVVEEFEKYCADTLGKNVKVEYSTVGTNEEMYTKINLNKESYDLVCPSEYMIQKMISENMLEPLDHANGKVQTYDDNVSVYISDLFKRTKTNPDDDSTSLYNYAACYMWGTMGFVYNPEFVSEESIKNWSAVWKDEYRNKCTIKDSVRDSYVLALGYAYHDQLMSYKDELDNGTITEQEYNKKLTDVFNSVSDEAIEKTGKLLSDLAPKLYGYEVDSGKKDMAAGKIWINFAWSGDAVYALDFAEDPEEVGDNLAELYYVVPEEGSNIFFDGWVMPKGSNTELAQQFINFISQPHFAQRNMDYIGYTTSIANDEIFENVIENYGYGEDDIIEEFDENENCIKYYALDENGEKVLDDDNNPITFTPVDLTYLFKKNNDGDKKYIVYTDTIGRQFSTQYPEYDIVKRCTVMRHFSNEEVVKLNKMWEETKPTALKQVFIASVIVFTLLISAYVIIKILGSDCFRLPVKKGFKAISKE